MKIIDEGDYNLAFGVFAGLSFIAEYSFLDAAGYAVATLFLVGILSAVMKVVVSLLRMAFKEKS